MSTRTFLDPRVRESRHRRANVVRQFQGYAARLADFKARAIAMVISQQLDDVRRDPRLYGSTKDDRFSAILRWHNSPRDVAVLDQFNRA